MQFLLRGDVQLVHHDILGLNFWVGNLMSPLCSDPSVMTREAIHGGGKLNSSPTTRRRCAHDYR
jgi:hypothetical protein